jgi:hypothetical protein
VYGINGQYMKHIRNYSSSSILLPDSALTDDGPESLNGSEDGNITVTIPRRGNSVSDD